MKYSAWLLASGLALSACAAPRAVPFSSGADSLLPPVQLEAEGAPIDSADCVAHSGPHLMDLDGDGLWDVLAGGDEGVVVWFRNGGQLGEPKLEAGRLLVEESERGEATGAPTRPGTRIQIDVGDYNDDGLLDLLVGDYQMAAAEQVDLSDEDLEQLAGLKAEREEIRDEIDTLFGRLESEGAEISDSNPEVEELMNRSQNNYMLISLLEQSPTRHGWVWLYQRKPAVE